MKHNIFEDNSSSMNLQINPADITEQVDFIEEILEKEPPINLFSLMLNGTNTLVLLNP